MRVPESSPKSAVKGELDCDSHEEARVEVNLCQGRCNAAVSRQWLRATGVSTHLQVIGWSLTIDV